ncbi:MAG: ABC transporter permease [Ruminococcaceae bacterium]|nr:ABC transporter permease [Oscillospiraceae bacterium]
MGKKSTLLSRVIGAPYILWAVLFIIVPIGMVAYYAFTDATGAFTFHNMLEIGKYTDTFLLSIWLGLLATVISLVIAYPLAYIIANSGENRQKIMMMLIMLPMWMNFLLRTYSWMTILEDNGFLTTTLNSVLEGAYVILDEAVKILGGGLKKPFEPIHLINTRGAVVLGMVYNFLPYMILPIYTVILKMDRSLIEAAQDLGCNKVQVFKNITIPLSLPGVVSGFTMVFVPSVSTFYISQKLGGTGTTLIGDIIETQFQTANNFHLGASLSFVLMILIFICLAVMNKFSDDDGEVII